MMSESLDINEVDVNSLFQNESEDDVIDVELDRDMDKSKPALKRPRIERLMAIEAVTETLFRMKTEESNNQDSILLALDKNINKNTHIIYKAVANVLLRKQYLTKLKDFLKLKIKTLWDNDELIEAVMNFSEQISEEVGVYKIKNFTNEINNAIHKEGKLNFLNMLMIELKNKSQELDSQLISKPLLAKQLLEEFGSAIRKFNELSEPVMLQALDYPANIQEELEYIKLQIKFIIRKTFELEKHLESGILKEIEHLTCYALTIARGELNRSCNLIEFEIQRYKVQVAGLGQPTLYSNTKVNLHDVNSRIGNARDYLKNIKDNKAIEFVERHFSTLFPQINDLIRRTGRLNKYLLQVAIFVRKVELL